MAIKAKAETTIIDVSDAYAVTLSSEAYTFMGGASGAASGLTCKTEVTAFCGANPCSKVQIGTITCPTGISATISNNNTVSPSITFKTTATISAACEATIPVVVDGITVNKKFSFAVAKAGSAGKGVASTAVTYQTCASQTTAPTGTWSSAPQKTTTDKPFLWTKTVWAYTDGQTVTSYSVSSTFDGIEIGGKNYIIYGKGDKKKGFFKNFATVTDEYAEHTLTSKKSYTNVSIAPGFVHTCREYEVGAKMTWSYDIMFTKWDFPDGTNRNEWWMGQRYTNSSESGATGQWRGVTYHKLPAVGSNGCELNEWYHVESTFTIPEQASASVGEAGTIQFYNSNADVAASVTFRLKNVKLEKGIKATTWTPSVEEVQSGIDDAQETANKALSTADVEYYLSTSATALSGGSWSTTAPAWVNGKYMWSRTVKIDGKGNKTYSPSASGTCIAGATGATGAAGKGISSITEQYYLSTSATSLSGGSWSTTRPTATAGKYIWTRSVITYTDGSSKTTEGISVTGDKGATGAKGDTGATGAAGRTFFLEPSCHILKRSADNKLLPTSIEFKAYYRDGTSATRSAYAGRFVVEKSTDGSTWTTAYTGTTNASTVTFTTSSLGSDIIHIRCKLYAAGGTTTLLDMQSVPVLKDISALTHEEIFNLLTNNGVVKGIYEENGQLYISFTYAKGGTLTLGGSGNGNGLLKILDASGNQVGYIDNTGVNFAKGTFTGTVNAASGTIANWVFDSKGLKSKNYNAAGGDGILLSGGDPANDVLPRFKLGEILMIPEDGVLKIKYGLQVHVKGASEEGFSDGSGRMKLIGLESASGGTSLTIKSNAIYKESSSSLRYKSLGKKMTEEDVEDLYNISTVWAKYKDGYLSSDDRRCGQYMPMFVAENVEQHLPIAVEYEDGKVEDWNQKIMTPAMFAMLKFQKQKIDALENEIEEIKRKLESITIA